MATVALVAADALSRYGFPDGHPFGPDRQEAFLRELRQSPAYGRLQLLTPRVAERDELEFFHDSAYVDLVIERSLDGRGYLDAGDTPAFRGIFEATSLVVGTRERPPKLRDVVAPGPARQKLPTKLLKLGCPPAPPPAVPNQL